MNTQQKIDDILKDWTEAMRPEADIRPELDIGYTWNGTDIFLNEIRPDWQQPEIIRHFPFAKIKYVKSRKLFKLYWMRASGKWEAYPLIAQSPSLPTLLEAVKDDALGCFFG